MGFDPYKGFFHANRHGKPSLALDLMEEFRPIIADSVVLTLINNEMLTPGDFVVWREACQLTEAGRRTVLPGLRAAEGDGGDAPGIRLQDVLFADAGGAGTDAGRVRSRLRAGVHRLHGAVMDSYIVAYDISDPKRLRKVATACEDFGYRKQFSVFLCRVSPTDLVRLRSRLYDMIDLAKDQVLFIPLCGEVRERHRSAGPAGGGA